MAYRRRYFPALTITTIALPSKVVVTDKIADKAVTQPKLADDAITTEKIVDREVKSEDIGHGAVKSENLADFAVTSWKIAPGSVTPDKMSVPILTRPITPGVATDEIAGSAITESKMAENSVGATAIKAGAVSAAKLAGNAVETAKIKDANVTGPKIAASSIDNTHLKVDSVRGTEIQAGAVGETELGTDSVVTDKVKDDAITTPKILDKNVTEPKLADAILAKRHIEKFYNENTVFYDDFLGAVLDNLWAQAGDAGGSVGLVADRAQVKTGAGSGDAWRINWNAKYKASFTTTKPKFSTKLSVASGSTTYIRLIVGLYYDDNNYIVFRAEDAVGATPTWKAVCRAVGAETVIDTTIPISVTRKLLKIDFIANDSVKFYVDGVEKAHITTNVPWNVDHEAYAEVKTNTATLRQLNIDHILILGDRV